jgi:hypothetical protein
MNRTPILPAVLLYTLLVNAQAVDLKETTQSSDRGKATKPKYGTRQSDSIQIATTDLTEPSHYELIAYSKNVTDEAHNSSNADTTPSVTSEVQKKNKALSNDNTSERVQIQTLGAFLIDALPKAEDQQLILQLFADLSKARIRGALTIRGPQDAYFYFEEWKQLSSELPRILPQMNANTQLNPKSQILPNLEQLMDPSSSLLSMQPARLKVIRMPFFSPVSGHRIASLRFKSISTMYNSFGPFRVPAPGYMLQGAELIITTP